MTNSEQDTSEIIKSFEEKEDLFSLRIRGVCVWRIIRSSVFSSVQNIGLNGGAGVKRKDVVVAALRSLPRILYAILNRKKLRYGVVSYPVALRIPNGDGRYNDFYYQEILDQMPGGVRLSNGPILRADRKTKEGILNLDLSIFSLFSLVLARIFPIESKDGVYAKISDALARELAVPGISELSLKRWFSIFWWESKVKGIFFNALGLEFIFTINSSEYIIVNSAIAEGIRTIELQHGVYTRNHPDALANEVVMKYGRNSLFLPDTIALYGNYWVNELRPIYNKSSVQVVAVGSNTCDFLRKKRTESYSRGGGAVTVLVTTQGMQKKELIDFIRGVLEISLIKINFIIKLHPTYDKDKDFYLHEFMSDDRIMIAAGDEDPSTSELLTVVDLHASIASMCHYDALSIGLPTIVIGLPGSELVSPIVENGSAVLVNNPAEMVRLIEGRKWIEPSREIQQYYCKSGFIENIKRLMD